MNCADEVIIALCFGCGLGMLIAVLVILGVSERSQ